MKNHIASTLIQSLPRLLKAALLGTLFSGALALNAAPVHFNLTYIAPPNQPSYPNNSGVWLDTDSGDYWNYIPTWGVWPTSGVYAAFDADNQASDIRFKTTSRFAYSTSAGYAGGDADYPDVVRGNGIYLSTTPIGGTAYTSSQIEITGLSTAHSHDFIFYGSHASNAGSLDITINGTYTGTLAFASGGNEAIITISNVIADSSGKAVIDFNLSSGSNNGYLNAITIIPEVGTTAFSLLAASGIVLILRRRKLHSA